MDVTGGNLAFASSWNINVSNVIQPNWFGNPSKELPLAKLHQWLELRSKDTARCWSNKSKSKIRQEIVEHLKGPSVATLSNKWVRHEV